MTFELDAFQKDALRLIDRDHSVLVSAPTGAGKTVIAEYAIEKALAAKKRVVYTAPIKALSNQKFRDFRDRYGEAAVGILTGDVSINSEASIVIMTTEIYRNCLFEKSARLRQIGWVIFDEIHYLDDVDRGTVWEEALLFTPPEIRILALSATVPNVRQLADWIRSIHDRSITVVEETHRPVPLHFSFQCQGKLMENLKTLRRDGYLNKDEWRIRARDRRRGMRAMRPKPNRLEPLLEHLVKAKKMPAIYFVFGRRRAEYLAEESVRFNFLTGEESREILRHYDDLLKQYDLKNEKSADQLRALIGHGIAYHHAGMLPTLKETIEQLFTSKKIKLIFTTETFALGINMPARTVIFDQLEKYYGSGFKHLSTRDFFQMAGRAGRRGMDKEGFVYVRINPRDIPFGTVQRVLYGESEPIHSQLNTAYATLLSLHRDLGDKLLEIYPRTFHHFQSHNKQRAGAEAMIRRKLDMLAEMQYLDTDGLSAKGEFAASLFGYELLTAEMHVDNVFEDLNEAKLNTLLSAFIFEPRKGDFTPKLRKGQKALRALAEHYARAIHRKELKYQVRPYTKPPHFNLAPVIEAWTGGEPFDKLFLLTGVDEGELVRHLRMVIQLLRELQHAAHTSEKLKKTAIKAQELINRGVVDAEKQLRV